MIEINRTNDSNQFYAITLIQNEMKITPFFD